MKAAPPILQLKEIRAFTAKPWSQQGISGSPVLHSQLHPRLQPLWRHPAEGMTCRQDGVNVGTSSARGCKDTKTDHYECGDLPRLVRFRLLLGKADTEVQPLGCALLPSTPLRRAAPRLGDSTFRHPWA